MKKKKGKKNEREERRRNLQFFKTKAWIYNGSNRNTISTERKTTQKNIRKIKQYKKKIKQKELKKSNRMSVTLD